MTFAFTENEERPLYSLVHSHYPHLLKVPLRIVEESEDYFVKMKFRKWFRNADGTLIEGRTIRSIPAVEVEVMEHEGFSGPANSYGIGKPIYYRKNELTGLRFLAGSMCLIPWEVRKEVVKGINLPEVNDD